MFRILKKLEEREFAQYADFAYALALDTTKSGYPTYTDGIKTRENFMDRARKALSRDNEDILLFEKDGRVAGWIHYFHLREDRYLGTCAFCVADGMRAALAEFTAFARDHFPGFALYLGFPQENLEAVAALDAMGFVRIEQSYNDVLDFESYAPLPGAEDVVMVTPETYALFSLLHAQHDTDMYWNTQRIRAALDQWRIFVLLQDGKTAGAIYYQVWEDKSMDEIFGVDFPDGVYNGSVFRSLMIAALNEEKRRGAEHMVFFNESESQADALDCGFRCVGGYVCYQTQL